MMRMSKFELQVFIAIVVTFVAYVGILIAFKLKIL